MIKIEENKVILRNQWISKEFEEDNASPEWLITYYEQVIVEKDQEIQFLRQKLTNATKLINEMAESKRNDIIQSRTLSNIEAPIIIIFGQTGSGKSAIANTLLGCNSQKHQIFQESSHIQSQTSQIEIRSGLLFGNLAAVTVIDTPGFFDSEKRSKAFFLQLVETMKSFPKDKLKLILFAIPLFETKVKPTYATSLDEVRLLIGQQLLPHTIFVTTCRNKVANARLADKRSNEWKYWLCNHFNTNNINLCDFVYGNPNSLHVVRLAFEQFPTFTPDVSHKIETYLEGNPFASVSEIIANSEALHKIKSNFNDKVNATIAQNEDYLNRLKSQSNLSNNQRNKMRATTEKVESLKSELLK